MHAQPPTAKPAFGTIADPWLPPVRYDAGGYRQLCQWIDQGLRELEARYPAGRLLSAEDRHRRLPRRGR